jgi:predicted metal-dependent phosphotriesterase family hydrolase
MPAVETARGLVDVSAHAGAQLNKAAAGGVGTIADATVLGLGRDIERIKAVAALTDLHIIVATGLSRPDSRGDRPARWSSRTTRPAISTGLPTTRPPRGTTPNIHDKVLPALAERGVSAGQIETMLVDNPRAISPPRVTHQRPLRDHRR